MTEPRNVNVTEAVALVANGARLLDVRETDEWDNGHAREAVHVPLAELPDHLGDLARDRLIVCACRSGGRSGRAARFLEERDFDVVNLDGGMLAWAKQGEALVAASGEPFVN